MKSITKIERDDYLIIPNPDLVNDYKFNLSNYTIGSGERALYFGELQVYNTLRVEGELNVLQGTVYNYTLSQSITSNQTLYGKVTVDGTIDIGAELTII
jgi:hypothetical protein